MGQYYHPVNLDKKEWLSSHSYDNGLKLMEHSYLGNDFVGAVESLLIPGGPWYKTRIVWAGDYADEEVGGEFYRLDESNEPMNIYSILGDPDWSEVCPKPLSDEKQKQYRYLVNHSKNQFVDRQNLSMVGKTEEDEPPFPNDGEGEWKINPLPLLTCEGNGRGGGDFHGEDERIGMWARDIISLEEQPPEDYEIINGLFIEN